MATLQKFKLLATHCVVAASPTRSPTMSPVIHLRRRKTLRMLLSRTGGGSRRLPQLQESPDREKTLPAGADPPEITKESVVVSHKLKDLLISSPPLEERTPEKVRDVGDGFAGGGGVGGRLGGRQCSLRPLSATFRQILLRRVWRPVLITIPEAE